MENLTLKDKKLLKLLDFNGRASYSALAKELKTSKQVVEYRLKLLSENNILAGYYPVINIPLLGYTYCRMFVSLKMANESVKEKMLAYFANNSKWFWVFTGQGIYDVMAAMWATSNLEFKQAVDEFTKQFGQYIDQRDIDFATNVVYFQSRYFLDDKETRQINIGETQERTSVDGLDKDILKLLCKDARMTLVQIGEELSISAKVASYRIKRLEKSGLIKGYRPNINYRFLGYTYYKLWFHINYEYIDQLEQAKTYLKNNPIVLYIVEAVGCIEELDIEVMVKSNEELFAFVQDLRNKFPDLIGGYRSVAFMGMHKARFLPFE